MEDELLDFLKKNKSDLHKNENSIVWKLYHFGDKCWTVQFKHVFPNISEKFFRILPKPFPLPL